jgi:hypothetical protein
MTRTKLAPFLVSTLVASVLALTGCAWAAPAAAGPTAPHPLIGFASPGNSAARERPARFESERLPPRPIQMSNSWAR